MSFFCEWISALPLSRACMNLRAIFSEKSVKKILLRLHGEARKFKGASQRRGEHDE